MTVLRRTAYGALEHRRQINETDLIVIDLGLVGETVGVPRAARVAPGGMVFHVLNRSVGRMRRFLKDADFEAFERVIEKTLESRPMRICTANSQVSRALRAFLEQEATERTKGTNSAYSVSFCSKSGSFRCGRRPRQAYCLLSNHWNFEQGRETKFLVFI